MTLLILLLLGAALGWVASAVMSLNITGYLINIAAGMLGALLGGWLLAPLLGGAALSADVMSPGELLQAALGAAALILVAQLVRKGMSMDDMPRDD